MHYHLSTTTTTTTTNSTTLSKRARRPRKMDKCIGVGMRGKRYARAKCRWAVGMQAVAVTCEAPHDPSQQVTSLQACIGDEICVETGYGDDYYTAYCVSTRNFMHLPAQETARGSGRWKIHGGAQARVADTDYTANVLLADESRKSRMQADVLEAVAWRRGSPSMVQVGEGVKDPGGGLLADRRLKAALCRQCSRLLMQPVPVDANLLVVVVSKRSEWKESGYLYVVTVS
ncbi:MAG: hypothetical protein Q9208_008643 [Pyrenodesmia sp. 3 TL-2023]